VSSTSELPAVTTGPPDPAGDDGGASGGARSFISGARILTIGIASTGVFTFLYLATASHVLSKGAYSLVSLCWSIMFVILSVIYRPIEQLLSRTIADRRARGLADNSLRTPATIQVSFAVLFLIVAVILRSRIQQGMFNGSSTLYWVLVIGVLAYAASYFARGWLAGHQRFALYGGLVFLESTSRFIPAVAVAVGITSGLGPVAVGMAIAPFVSLSVIPFAFSRLTDALPSPDAAATVDVVGSEASQEGPAQARLEEGSSGLSLRHGADFAISVVGVMLAEQTLMNAGVLIIAAKTAGGAATLTAGLTGFVFNVMLIVRAPLQLFQAIQTSILPHLAGLEAREDSAEFHRAIRTTVLVITAFGLAVALGLLVIGPPVMKIVLGDKGFGYQRVGLAVVGLGMGLHLVAGTLNQAALARGRARWAAGSWLTAAALFVIFIVTGPGRGHAAVNRVEFGYFGATAVLAALLWILYRRGPAVSPGGSERAGGLGDLGVGGRRVA
jgi:O-antigen/teichoic acid export membrane protein